MLFDAAPDSLLQMNIAILSDHFLPQIGGGEFIVHYWAEGLAKRGHQVVVPTLRPINQSEDQGMRFSYSVDRSAQIPYAYTLSRLIQLYRIHHNFKLDIVHANFIYPAGRIGTLIQRWLGVPCVVSGQGSDILVYEPLQYGNLLNPEVLRKTKKVLTQAAGLIFNCDRVKDRFAELGASPDRMYNLYNGTSLDKMKSDQRAILRTRYGIGSADVVFITVCRHSPIKGLHVLLEAVRILKDHKTPFKVMLVGPRVEKLRNAVKENGIEERILIVGELPLEVDTSSQIPNMPSQAVVDHLFASDVFISPSLSGTFELSASDAMAAGRAIIVSDNIGNKDVVENGTNGFVFANGDAQELAGVMKVMLDNPSGIQGMGDKNRELAKTLDWNYLSGELESIYRKVIMRWRSEKGNMS